MSLMRNNIFIISIILIICFFHSNEMKGQMVNYRINVYEKQQDKQIPLSVYYTKDFATYKEAQDIFTEIKPLIDQNKFRDPKLRDDYKIKQANGIIEFQGFKGQGTIIFSPSSSLADICFLLNHTDELVKGKPVPIDAFQRVTINCSKEGDTYVYDLIFTSTQLLDNVDVKEKGRKNRNRRGSIDLGGTKESWSYTVMLPYGYHEENSRIIIIPYAVDCNTEDTVDYLVPAVYEGDKYHVLQDRRKDFDYLEKDPFGKDRVLLDYKERVDTIRRPPIEEKVLLRDSDGNYDPDNPQYKIRYKPNDSIYLVKWTESDTIASYKGSIANLEHDLDNHCIVIDTTIVWTKPDKNKSYRGKLLIAMEDYHRKYFELHNPGTCLKRKPFKFLEMENSMQPLTLSSEFYERAELASRDGGKEDLGMQFTHGTAELIEDSVYLSTLEEIESDMDNIISSHGQILSAKLIAYASPDGTEKRNHELTQQRAHTALAKIRYRVPSNVKIEATHEIDSWEHTADRLEAAGYMEEAKIIREIAAANPSTEAAFRIIAQKCPNYKEVVKPILESQCRISFSYKFVARRVLSDKEALATYLEKKHHILPSTFSNGDYYNIFSLLKDPAELDTLTEIAYKIIIKSGRNYDKLFAPYIINRMAMLNMKRGRPDTLTLAPMITERFDKFTINHTAVDKRVSDWDIKFNRPEIVLNQAIMFYELEKYDRAKEYLEYLSDYDSPERQNLLAYIRFKELYARLSTGELSDSEMRELENAQRIVEQSSPDNRAVLYTEFIELGKRSQAWKWVHLMDDNNPRKWYLMALLWATRDGQESAFPLTSSVDNQNDGGFELLTEDEAMDLNIDNPQKWTEYKKWEAEFLAQNPDAKPKPKKKAEPDPDANVDVEGIPYYMAYFQKSFDLDKSGKNEMAKYYFNEGFISEETRTKKNHAYKNDRIAAYRKIYRLRQAADDEERAKYVKEVEEEKIAQEKYANIGQTE